ncbi:MAG: triose-phosphate isomerase [Fimbriimonas ginsengisoli]|uniref:Triosephosphate isomerase n=1 Tax=Fimbriimonas ginsengisoli TaxID=1005039 RepID=A0A931PVU5_FIMGI|nr:triose-phosphate isomerase [Fimbriimonas ginsengisoli]
MRTRLVVGNWKMNFTEAEATAAVQSFIKMVSAKSTVDVVVCPPATCIHSVRELVKDTHVKVGAQDVFWEDAGAFTGRISPRMLDDAGVTHCIVGHSETRGRFGKLEVPASTVSTFVETNETINLKLKALLFHALIPILCVGETTEERKEGFTEAVIREQLAGALAGIDASELYFFVVAYEPVWAIGTGNTCEPEEAGRVCRFVSSVLAELLDADVAENIRVLYGGSVRAANAGDLFQQDGIDGGLVGGASLDPLEFSRIVMSA